MRYLVRRIAQLAASLMAVFLLSRALIHALPGDPLDFLLAETALKLPREQIAHDLGLDVPFVEACRRDLLHLLRGDLGYSLVTRQPVLPMLLERLSRTLALAFGALVLALTIALPSALFCAFPQASPSLQVLQRAVRRIAMILISIPLAWVGPAVLYLFAVLLPWAEFQASLGLACFALALPLAGSWFRIIELRTREELRQPFYRAALARGLPPVRAILKNGLAPSLGALLAILGSQAGSLLAGSFIVEWIFDWPGMGVAWVQATLQRDYPVMEGATLLGASTCLIGVFVGDLLQKAWDPRQRGLP